MSIKWSSNDVEHKYGFRKILISISLLMFSKIQYALFKTLIDMSLFIWLIDKWVYTIKTFEMNWLLVRFQKCSRRDIPSADRMLWFPSWLEASLWLKWIWEKMKIMILEFEIYLIYLNCINILAHEIMQVYDVVEVAYCILNSHQKSYNKFLIILGKFSLNG